MHKTLLLCGLFLIQSGCYLGVDKTGIAFEGAVTELASGAPIQGVRVELRETPDEEASPLDSLESEPRVLCSTQTLEDGTFEQGADYALRFHMLLVPT